MSATTSVPNLPVLVIQPQFGDSASYYAVIRPTGIYFGGSSVLSVLSITWAYWTRSSALGHGLQTLDNCAPTCANGVITKVPATIALSLPVNGQFTSLAETSSGQTATFAGPELIIAGAVPDSAKVPLPSPNPPTTQPSRASTVPLQAGGVAAFLSPSRNIGCELDYQRSGVANATYCQTISPPQSVTMSASGTFKTCTGSNCVGNHGIDTPILAFGQTIGIGPFSCRSAISGVTCTVSGRGFTISSAGVATVG